MGSSRKSLGTPSLKKAWDRILKGPPARMEECPRCGSKVARYGGSWLTHRMAVTIRVEFCLNPTCGWCRKLEGIGKDFREVK